MTSSRSIIIPDSSSTIRYSGTWYNKTYPMGIQNSLITPHAHFTNESGASMFMSYQGTNIGIQSTNLVRKRQSEPVWECFVDGMSLPTHPPPGPNVEWTFCDTQDMNITEGEHTVSINVTSAGDSGFLVNSITLPSSDEKSLESNLYRIDKADPAIIYNGKWSSFGGFANATSAMSADVTLGFTGKGISWIGYTPVELPHTASTASYSIDGNPAVNFTLPGLPPNATRSTFAEVFFTISNLEPRMHTLVVTYLGWDKETPLTLNYLDVLGPLTNTTTIGSTQTITQPTSPSSPNQSPQRSVAGPVAGGVVGGLLLLALFAILLLYLRRRRRMALNFQPRMRIDDTEGVPAYLPNPYDLIEKRAPNPVARPSGLSEMMVSHDRGRQP